MLSHSSPSVTEILTAYSLDLEDITEVLLHDESLTLTGDAFLPSMFTEVFVTEKRRLTGITKGRGLHHSTSPLDGGVSLNVILFKPFKPC